MTSQTQYDLESFSSHVVCANSNKMHIKEVAVNHKVCDCCGRRVEFSCLGGCLCSLSVAVSSFKAMTWVLLMKCFCSIDSSSCDRVREKERHGEVCRHSQHANASVTFLWMSQSNALQESAERQHDDEQLLWHVPTSFTSATGSSSCWPLVHL